jgi:predicted nucleic acid-binding protein
VLATARREGRTAKATDLLIIATARATQRRLVTLDDRQAKLARASGIDVHVP